MGDVKFKRKGRGEFRGVRLVGFPKLGKAGMDGIGMVGRTEVLGPKAFPTKLIGKGSNKIKPAKSDQTRVLGRRGASWREWRSRKW